MPDLVSEAAGRIRVRGADEAMLERIWGGYRAVYQLHPEEPGQALSWLLSYDGAQANPVAQGERVRVEHELTAIRVPRVDGYELHIPERDAVVVRTAGHISVRGAPEVAKELLRKAVRQVLTRSEQRQGMVQLHASAVADPSGGVLAFVGPKGAGKTTTLTTALVHGGMSLVSNDRLCLVGSTSQGPSVYGWPTDYPVGHGTLQLVGLWDRVPVEMRDLREKMHFTPEFFIELCGGSSVPRGHLRAIAFTELDLSSEEVEIGERDAPDAVAEILDQHVFGVEEDEDHPDWLELGGDVRPDQGLELAAARLRAVRFYRYRIGRDVNRIAAGVAELQRRSARPN